MNQKKYLLGGVFALVLLSGVIVFTSPVLRGSSQFAALEGEDVREPGLEGGFVFAPDGQDPFQDFDPDDFGDRYFGPDGGDHGMRGDAKEIAREALNLILENMEKLSLEDQERMDAITSKLIRIKSDQFTEAAELLDEAAAVFENANIPVVGGGGPGGPPMDDMMEAVRAGIDLLGRYADPSGVEDAIDEIMEACSSGDIERCEDAAGGMEDLMMDLTRDAHRNAEAEDGWDAAVALCIDFMTVMEPVIDDPMIYANGVEFACEMFGKMGWDPRAMDDGGDYGGGDYGGDYGGGGDHGAEECVKQGGNWDGEKCNFPNYCEMHPNECGGGGDYGGDTGGFTGPGGCGSVEECTQYCSGGDHAQECEGYCEDYPYACHDKEPPTDTQSCITPPGLIVSWWNADNVSGTTVPDGSNVHRNNGTIVGGVTAGAVDIGYVFEFDGSSGYINMGNPESLNFGTGPFSLEAWLYWDGGGSSINNIMRKSNYPVSGPGAGYWLRIGRDSSTIEFSVGATTGSEGQSLITAPISSGVWHHVVATRDGSDTVRLYIDGESTGTVIRQASNAATISGAPFTLGAWVDRFGVSELFSGYLDQVSVYTNALNASDVQDLFYAGSTRKCAS